MEACVITIMKFGQSSANEYNEIVYESMLLYLCALSMKSNTNQSVLNLMHVN